MVKIVKRIIDVVFVLIILLLSLYYVLRLTGNVIVFKVQTGSMEDKIHINDYILVVKEKDYKVGDIITYKYEGNYVTHRIVKKDNDIFITKGDSNNTEDEEINIKQITGKVLIIGGILNIVINYKFIIIAIMLIIYLITCYLNKISPKKQEVKNEKSK
jgi:signal peptidase